MSKNPKVSFGHFEIKFKFWFPGKGFTPPGFTPGNEGIPGNEGTPVIIVHGVTGVHAGVGGCVQTGFCVGGKVNAVGIVNPFPTGVVVGLVGVI